jgi:hypothetical protein
VVEGSDEGQRRARIAANEALYRSVNEQLEALNQVLTSVADDGSMVIICECRDVQCAEQIEVTVEMYESVRADPTLFIIVPGHEINDVEDIVAHHESFDIVCKHKGEGARVARDTDPRR